MNIDDFVKLYKETVNNKCDLFLISDIIYDFTIAVNKFNENKRKTIVLIPGKRSIEYGGFCIKMYDVSMLENDSFRKYLTSAPFEIIIPFAECADISEYGHYSSYAWLGEIRAESAYDIHITAIVSPGFGNIEELSVLFACRDAVIVNIGKYPDCSAFKCNNKKQIYSMLKNECTKAVGRKIAILFTTRREADEFKRVLDRYSIGYVSIFGNNFPCDRNELDALKNITQHKILIGTKSSLLLSAFIKYDKVIYCGMPYSISHLVRCGRFSSDNKIDIYFTEEDIKTNIKIIHSVAEYYPEYERSNYVHIRNIRLEEAYNFIREYT